MQKLVPRHRRDLLHPVVGGEHVRFQSPTHHEGKKQNLPVHVCSRANTQT